MPTPATPPHDTAPAPGGGLDVMGPAGARHARDGEGRWQRKVTAGGQEVLAASAESIAEQVDLVAERMIAALEQRRQARESARRHAGHPDPAWDTCGVEISFGVQLTGEASLAVFSASAESSAQITLTFTRTPRA
jgi:hypothetical protein